MVLVAYHHGYAVSFGTISNVVRKMRHIILVMFWSYRPIEWPFFRETECNGKTMLFQWDKKGTLSIVLLTIGDHILHVNRSGRLISCGIHVAYIYFSCSNPAKSKLQFAY